MDPAFRPEPDARREIWCVGPRSTKSSSKRSNASADVIHSGYPSLKPACAWREPILTGLRRAQDLISRVPRNDHKSMFSRKPCCFLTHNHYYTTSRSKAHNACPAGGDVGEDNPPLAMALQTQKLRRNTDARERCAGTTQAVRRACRAVSPRRSHRPRECAGGMVGAGRSNVGVCRSVYKGRALCPPADISAWNAIGHGASFTHKA